jgi:hypothetical protein
MTDFYHAPFSFALFLKFLILGLVCAALFIPTASTMHAAGHGLFGMLGGCRWVGMIVPMEGHAQAIVNYPVPTWPATKGSLVLWLGGYFWSVILFAVILLFPTTDSLIQNLCFQLAGFHLALFGFLKEVLAGWDGPDVRTAAEVMGWDAATVGIILLACGVGFTVLFAVRSVRMMGHSLQNSAGLSFALGFALWFFPSLLFLVVSLIQAGTAWIPQAALLAFVIVLLLLSPLIPPGDRLWQMPAFARPLYGLLLAAIVVILLAVFLAGWGSGARPMMWGPAGTHSNYDFGVRL